MFGSGYDLAQQQLRTIDAGIRLVVIHPNYIQPHLLLAAVLPHEKTAYVRFEGHDISGAQVNAQLDSALAAQTDGAGMAAVQNIILDECDRVCTDDLDALLVSLVDQGQGRIFVLSRTPPKCTLEQGHVRQQTAYLPVDESLMLWDYARRDEERVLLEVRALGAGRVLLNGVAVDNWDGLLPRSLFFYLVDRGMTTRNDIFETFWPNLTVREATNVFHVTKRKISEVLGVDLTMYWSGFYHIAPHIELSYDVVHFSELVQSSFVATPENAQTMLRQAIMLYRDEFLRPMDMPWVQSRRQELQQSYGEALVALARMLEKDGAKDEALGLYLRATPTNRQREDLAGLIMNLYREMGQPEDALRVYQHLEAELLHSLGVGPARQLQQLAEEIREGVSV